MARGQILKQDITNKILEFFPGSFVYGKEIRIPGLENGETLQIKCSLTCAKENVEQGGDNMTPGESITTTSAIVEKKEPVQVSKEEKVNIAKMLESLGL